ncbi:MAG: ABC transporter permease [Actinobacteria bacterium]|nr:ABC transporter permease [Actinomycetota bacterium]
MSANASVADPPAPDRTPAGEGRKGARGAAATAFSSKRFQGSITFLAFIAIFIGYGLWLGEKFANIDARALDIHQNTPVLLLGLAVLVTLIAGQFDLSVASMATLTTYLVIGLKVNQGWPFALVLGVCILIGLIGGLVNGLLVVRCHVNTFIATLGTGGIFAGLASVYGKGGQLAPTGDSHQLPSWFSGTTSLGGFGEKFPAVVLWIGLCAVAVFLFLALRRLRPPGRSEAVWTAVSAAIVAVLAVLALTVLKIQHYVDAVSWTIGILIVVAVLLWTLLDHTTYGRYLRAVGSNAEAARLAGVKPGKETIKAFVLGGLLASFAGILLGANQGSASPEVAAGFLLPAFAAAFLSTVVLSTGRFNVWGTLIGGIFLVWVGQGLVVGGVPFTWTGVVNGFVLVLAVAISTVLRRRGAGR